MQFKDHFSSHAQTYASARPDYPDALFEFLANQCQQRKLAWDCATGNGQAALALATYFERVLATDASESQLQAATPHEKIEYRALPAEQAPVASESIDLVCVAQALHWFDIPAFFESVDTVLSVGGVLAIWCYGHAQIEPTVDRVIDGLYTDILDSYWPPERAMVERAYADISFPYTSLSTPEFGMQRKWSLQQLLAYLESWSATQRYLRQQKANPLQLIEADLRHAWGDASQLTVTWPLTLKLSRK